LNDIVCDLGNKSMRRVINMY